MFFIGIDLSDKVFDSCITNSFSDVVSKNRFDFNDDGFCNFIRSIHKLELGNQNCIVGLENPRSRLVDFLIQRGYTVLAVNPKAIARYRESRSPSKAKSDQADAQLIADYIREHSKTLKAIKTADEKIRELRLLLEDRDRLVQQKVRFSKIVYIVFCKIEIGYEVGHGVSWGDTSTRKDTHNDLRKRLCRTRRDHGPNM